MSTTRPHHFPNLFNGRGRATRLCVLDAHVHAVEVVPLEISAWFKHPEELLHHWPDVSLELQDQKADMNKIVPSNEVLR